jgi:multidrug efflux pump subunit AcrA (membrane-fusion protein)
VHPARCGLSRSDLTVRSRATAAMSVSVSATSSGSERNLIGQRGRRVGVGDQPQVRYGRHGDTSFGRELDHSGPNYHLVTVRREDRHQGSTISGPRSRCEGLDALRPRRFSVFGALAAGCLAGAFAITELRAASPRSSTAQVVRSDVVKTLKLSGAVQAGLVYQLSFGTTSTGSAGDKTDRTSCTDSPDHPLIGLGPVRSVQVAPGESVSSGQVLAQADTSALSADLAAAQQDFERARSQLDLAEADALAAGDLIPAVRGTSKTDAAGHNTAESSLQGVAALGAVQTRVEHARERVDRDQREIARASISAPTDGVIEAVNAVVGATPSCSAPAIRMRSATLEVTTALPARLLSSVADKQPVLAELPDLGRTLNLHFSMLALRAAAQRAVARPDSTATSSSTPDDTAMPLALTVTKPPPEMLPGMRAVVTIELARHRSVLAVPSRAVHRNSPDAYVTRAECRKHCDVPVEVGLSGDTLTEVASADLHAGDLVTAEGDSLQPTFSDDFSGPAGGDPNIGLSQAAWNLDNCWASGCAGNLAEYRQQNAQLDGQGDLVLKASQGGTSAHCGPRTCTHTSAGLTMLASPGNTASVAQQYGHFEARIKARLSTNYRAAFWIEGADPGSWPEGGEVDIFDADGREPGEVRQYAHGDTKDADLGGGWALPQGKSVNDWHTYAVDWTPSGITWKVDGDITRFVGAADLRDGWKRSFEHPFAAAIELSVVGDTTEPSASVLIDYVRFTV